MFLRSLSDQAILSRIQKLTRHERRVTLAVLLHFNEIARRKLHLKLGYASLFSYCTEGLGYSSSAAARRIRTARCVARFPEVYALLEANEVNLTTIAMVTHILTPGNKADLLTRIRRKSQREVKAIVAKYNPQAAIPQDVVRPIAIRLPALAGSAVSCGLFIAGSNPEPTPGRGENHSWGGSDRDAPTEGPAHQTESGAKFVVERQTQIGFTASDAFMAKFRKIQSLAWHRLPANPSVAQVLELAMDAFLEKEDPLARRERRAKRKEPATTSAKGVRVMSNERSCDHRARHVAAPVRDEVFARDEGQCIFRGPDGRRCASTRALQIDHIAPVARGGRGTADNLRLLCAYHNRLESERLMGVVHKARACEGSLQLPLRQ